jgi:hypothetical protein
MAQLRIDPKNAEAVPKILRIGIIQHGKIVEERLVRKRENVTIGQSSKNTFVVPASNYLPRSFTLFELTHGGYALNFTDQMDGRVSLGEQVVALPQLRQAGRAARRGDTWHLALSDKSRGKVVIGDVTVLFQFVAPPPVQPRPQLPPSVRSSLIQNLDWMLVAVVAASFLSHFGFVVYLRNLDFPRKPDIEEIPDKFVHYVVPPKKEEKKPVEVAKADEGKTEEKKKKPSSSGSGDKNKGPKQPRDAEEEARRAAQRRAELASKVRDMGALNVLVGRGEGGNIVDTLTKGGVSGDSDKVFSQVGGVGVAGSGSGGLRSARGAGGTGSLRGGGSLRASGPGDVGSGERGAEHVVKAVIKDSAPESVDGTLDPSVIVKEIKSRLGAIKACYESGLKRNPSIGGKLVVRFSVSAIGKVTKTEIEDDRMHDDDVANCIKSRVSSWRFPAPPGGGTTEFSYPFIFQSSK